MNTYFTLAVDAEVSLVAPTLSMAQEIFDLVDSDRPHLRKFLDFVDDTKEAEDEKKYLQAKLSCWLQETDRLFCIAYQGQLVGSIDLHFINLTHKKGEIGYWLHSDYTKKGIMKRAVLKVCELAFTEMGLNKLSIVADVDNEPSNAVARSCGFSLSGTEPKDVLLYGEYRDMNRYALLKEDFLKSSSAVGQ